MQGADINLQREVRWLTLSGVGLDGGLLETTVCGDIGSQQCKTYLNGFLVIRIGMSTLSV